MAGLTGLNDAVNTGVVMTDTAVCLHISHTGVSGVVEGDRSVKVGQSVQNDQVGNRLFLARDNKTVVSGAIQQAGILGCRIIAEVAGTTKIIELADSAVMYRTFVRIKGAGDGCADCNQQNE